MAPPSGDEPATGFMSGVTEAVKSETGEVRSIPFVVPAPPKFETLEEERQYRKVRLAMALRVFGGFGQSSDWLCLVSLD